MTRNPAPVTNNDVMAIDDRIVTTARGADPPATRGWNIPAARLAPLAIVAVVLGWAYAPNLRELGQTWMRDPNYSHGFLVIPVALVILWQRRPGPGAAPRSPSLWGWVVLVAALAARAACYERGKYWSESATLLPAVAGLALAYGGWPLLRRSWPAIAFLGFMLPLPPRINAELSLPLQRLATAWSCSLVRLSGLWVMAEGNILVIGSDRLEVAAVCNGLAMLMSLAATVAATTILIPMATWKRLVLLASIVPIALVCNILRIAATAWCDHRLGAAAGGQLAHDMAGWLMMPMALLLVGLELWWLSWLVVEEEAPTHPHLPLLPARTGGGADARGLRGQAQPGVVERASPGPLS